MGERHEVRAAPRARVEQGARCPYCHAAIALEGRVWLACEGCLARHHLGCWNTAGRCGTCGDGRAVGPVSGGRARELDAVARRHRWESLLTIVVLVALVAGALGWVLGRWWTPAPPPDPAPALRASLHVAQVERARFAGALALVRLGRGDLADRLLEWEGLDAPQRRELRRALGWFLLAESRAPDRPEARRALGQDLEAALAEALGPG